MSRYILILILLVFSMVSRAQDTSKAYRNTVAGSYNFWFYRPDEDESDGVHRPLLIFLHGNGGYGNAQQFIYFQF